MRFHRHLAYVVLLASIGISQRASAADGHNARFQLARASLAITKRVARKRVIEPTEKQKVPAELLSIERNMVDKAHQIVDPLRGLTLFLSEVKAEARDEHHHTMISTPLGVFSASSRGMGLRVDRDGQGNGLAVPYAEQIRRDLRPGEVYYNREIYPEQRIVVDEAIRFHTIVPVEGRRHPLATREIGKMLGADPVIGTTLVRRSRRGDSAETLEVWRPDAAGVHQRVNVDPAKHETLTMLWNHINETLDPAE